MIVDALLTMIGSFFSFILGLLPSFTFLDDIISAKNKFIDFILEFMEYTLYIFNVPVLKFTLGLLVTYLTFIALEYTIKLIVKYTTRLL